MSDTPLGAGRIERVRLGDLKIARRVSTRAEQAGLSGATKNGYQRDITSLAAKIAAEFNLDLFERPVVNKRPNGSYYVMDGGNRVAGALFIASGQVAPPKNLNITLDTVIEVIVHEVAVKQEPLLFARLNTERKTVDSVTVFLAEVDAGHGDAPAIQATLMESGWKIGYKNGMAVTKAVRTVRAAYDSGLLGDLAKAMVPWVEFGGKATEAVSVGAVFRFLLDYEGWNLDDLISTLDRLAPRKVFERAVEMRRKSAGEPITVRTLYVGHTLSPWMADIIAKEYRKDHGLVVKKRTVVKVAA